MMLAVSLYMTYLSRSLYMHLVFLFFFNHTWMSNFVKKLHLAGVPGVSLLRRSQDPVSRTSAQGRQAGPGVAGHKALEVRGLVLASGRLGPDSAGSGLWGSWGCRKSFKYPNLTSRQTWEEGC